MSEKKYKNPLSRHLLLGCLLFVLVLSFTIGVISFFIFSRGMMRQYERHLRAIMEFTLSRIDVDDLVSCMDTGTPSEEYEELLSFMDQAKLNYDLDYLVIIRPVKEGDTYDVMQVASGLSPEERAGVNQKEMAVPLLGDMMGDFYPPDFLPQIYSEMITLNDIEFHTSATEFGKSYDGVCPIRDSSGNGVALLTAGLSLDFIQSVMESFIVTMLIVVVAVSVVFLIFMMAWLRRRVVTPLKKIETSAGEFAKKSKGQKNPEILVMERPDIHTNDELEALSDTLVTMSESMKEYVEDLLSSAREIDGMKQKLTIANNEAIKDPLTGVKNKAGYDKVKSRLDWDIINKMADFGILMIDINFLKQINDNYGHEKGDIYIRKTCKMICDVFSHSPVFRVGGDEFVVILENRDFDNRDSLISEITDRMYAFQKDRSLEAWERVSAAIGLAVYDSTIDDNVDHVFKRADQAMYENKKAMKAVRE